MRNHILALFVAFLAFGLTGCGDSNDFNSVSGQQGNPGQPAPIPDPTPAPTPATDGFVRVAQLAATQSNVDVLLNGQQVLTNTEQATATNYVRVDAGSVRIQVRATGTTTDLLDTTQTVTKDSYNTFAIIGTNVLLPVQQVGGLSLLALVDDITSDQNRVNVRFANIVPDEDYADARLTSQEGKAVLAGPVSFGQATGYNDFTPALGGNRVEVRGDIAPFAFDYSILVGGSNKNIIQVLLEALGGKPVGNLTAFFGYGGELQFPGFVLVDRGTDAAKVYVFAPNVPRD